MLGCLHVICTIHGWLGFVLKRISGLVRGERWRGLYLAQPPYTLLIRFLTSQKGSSVVFYLVELCPLSTSGR